MIISHICPSFVSQARSWHLKAALALTLTVCAVIGHAMTGPAHAAQDDPRVGPRPDWADIAPIPEPDAALELEVSDGIYVLMADDQRRWNGDTETYYRRRVRQIIDRSGLEGGSSFQINYDPSRETLTLNSVRIKRNGVWRDATEDTKLEILRQESNIGNGILDGELSLLAILPNVQVGDTIDYAATLVDSRPMFKAHYAATAGYNGDVPIGFVRTQVSLPAGTKVELREHGLQAAAPDVVKGDIFDTYTWARTSVRPIPDEDSRPGSHVHWSFAELSTWPDWSAMMAELLPHYDPNAPLPADYRKTLDEIAEKWPAPEDRLTEVLRLVQDEIRYLSLVMGTGGYIPRRPDVVLASGYGDCKDKSLLLAAALRHVGVDAQVALVNTRSGAFLPQRLPSNLIFNHAITRAEIDGKVFWLDPTLTHQGGRGVAIAQAYLSNALVIKEGVNAFEKMPDYVPDVVNTEMIEHIGIPRDWNHDMTLEILSIYKGPAADEMRRSLATNGRTSLGRGYLEYYETLYPGIRPTAALEVFDDRDGNRVTTKENYSLSPEVLRVPEIAENFTFKASPVFELLPRVSAAGRTAPYALGDRRKVRHTIFIDSKKLNLKDAEPLSIDTPYFTYRRTSAGPAFYEWTAELKADVVPAEALRDHLTKVDKARDEALLAYPIKHYLDELDKRKAAPPSAFSKALDGFFGRAMERAGKLGGTPAEADVSAPAK